MDSGKSNEISGTQRCPPTSPPPRVPPPSLPVLGAAALDTAQLRGTNLEGRPHGVPLPPLRLPDAGRHLRGQRGAEGRSRNEEGRSRGVPHPSPGGCSPPRAPRALPPPSPTPPRTARIPPPPPRTAPAAPHPRGSPSRTAPSPAGVRPWDGTGAGRRRPRSAPLRSTASAAPRPPPAARSYPARCCRSPAWGRANAPLLPSLRTPRPQHRHHTRRSCSAGS